VSQRRETFIKNSRYSSRGRCLPPNSSLHHHRERQLEVLDCRLREARLLAPLRAVATG
jgi:hypothetical protein